MPGARPARRRGRSGAGLLPRPAAEERADHAEAAQGEPARRAQGRLEQPLDEDEGGAVQGAHGVLAGLRRQEALRVVPGHPAPDADAVARQDLVVLAAEAVEPADPGAVAAADVVDD